MDRSTGKCLSAHNLESMAVRWIWDNSVVPRRWALPVYLGGCSKHRADLEYLVDLTCPGKEGSEGVHLGHDAADCPQVHRRVVVSGAKEDLRGTVPGGR